MPTTITVPDNYGYVILVALGVIPVLAVAQGSTVTTTRRSAGVPYPNAYATPQQVKENKAAYTFNCAQRAHAQLMENMPQTIISMLVAGLTYPIATTGLGLSWVLMRMIYAYGYITSAQPNGSGRKYGGLFWLAQGGIWGLACATAIKLI